MKFWLSGEIDSKIGDSYHRISNKTESWLNVVCSEKYYGDVINKFAIIPIVLGNEYVAGRTERKLWKRKDRIADYRLIVNYELFAKGDDSTKFILLINNVIEAAEDLHRKSNGKFNGHQLVNDLKNALTEQELQLLQNLRPDNLRGNEAKSISKSNGKTVSLLIAIITAIELVLGFVYWALYLKWYGRFNAEGRYFDSIESVVYDDDLKMLWIPMAMGLIAIFILCLRLPKSKEEN